MNRIVGHMYLYELLNLVAIAGFRGAFLHQLSSHYITVATIMRCTVVLNVGIIFAVCAFVLP